MKKNIRNVLLYIGIPVILVLSYLFVGQITEKSEKVKYYEIIQQIRNNEISEFELNTYSGKLTNSSVLNFSGCQSRIKKRGIAILYSV